MVGRRVLAAAGVGAGIASGLLALAAPDGTRARAERFKLSPELEARVAAHRELVANAGRSTEDFCKLAADAVELLDPTLDELRRFEGDRHRSPPFSAIQNAYAATGKRVLGLHLDAFEEGYRTGIDYPKLGKLAPPEARPLLRAMDGFETVPEGPAVWVSLTTDYSGCHDPVRASQPLATLVKAWSSAPSCLRDAFRTRLNRELEAMATDKCYCEERKVALAAVRRNARALRSLTDTDGPGLADRLLDSARAPDAHFNCHPSG